MAQKVVIVTEIVAPYRIPVFNALAERPDIDLHVIFLAETDPALRQWLIYKEEIKFSYEVLRSWRLRFGRMCVLVNWGLRAALKKSKANTVICGGYNYIASWETLFWSRRRKTAFVLWSESNGQDTRTGRRWIESMKTYFVRRCDGFVVPGRAAFDYLAELGAVRERTLVAPNAVDNDLFAAQSAKTRDQARQFQEKYGLASRFILFAGRLVPEKGVFDLLDAYAKLDDRLRSEVGLVYAGDGVCKSELVRRSKDVKPGIISVTGFSQREDLSGFYALADVLVLPTHSDTWGLVVNEAMACGLPVIVSSVAGCAADLVGDGVNGYVVPAQDSERLREAIASILEQPELRHRMGEHSLERIRSYSPEACASGLAAVAALVSGRTDEIV